MRGCWRNIMPRAIRVFGNRTLPRVVSSLLTSCPPSTRGVCVPAGLDRDGQEAGGGTQGKSCQPGGGDPPGTGGRVPTGTRRAAQITGGACGTHTSTPRTRHAFIPPASERARSHSTLGQCACPAVMLHRGGSFSHSVTRGLLPSFGLGAQPALLYGFGFNCHVHMVLWFGLPHFDGSCVSASACVLLRVTIQQTASERASLQQAGAHELQTRSQQITELQQQMEARQQQIAELSSQVDQAGRTQAETRTRARPWWFILARTHSRACAYRHLCCSACVSGWGRSNPRVFVH